MGGGGGGRHCDVKEIINHGQQNYSSQYIMRALKICKLCIVTCTVLLHMFFQGDNRDIL